MNDPVEAIFYDDGKNYFLFEGGPPWTISVNKTLAMDGYDGSRQHTIHDLDELKTLSAVAPMLLRYLNDRANIS